jgi:preprotein translocase subunit SecD
MQDYLNGIWRGKLLKMAKVKKIFTHVRVVILIIALLLSVIAIHPIPWQKGVAIRTVISNSSAYLAGITSPKPSTPHMSREIIQSINNAPIENLEDYYNIINNLKVNQTVQIVTNKGKYFFTTVEQTDTIELNQTENKTVTEVIGVNETINGSQQIVNKTINTTMQVPKVDVIHYGVPRDIGLRVYQAPTTNLRKGLDLQGGTRVLLQPEVKLSEDNLTFLIDNMERRLNVYGLSDLSIRRAGDLSGNQYILVEIAGANEEEVKDLLAKQGKFEAKIGNTTVFVGGRDITYVCRSADCAGIDPSGCGQSGDGWACRFRFAIRLTQEAADRQAEITKDMPVITENGQEYLAEKLILYLDDVEVDQLNIGSDLRGRAVTDIEISGPGTGLTEQEAAYDALTNMKKLQTVLTTGSLPVKLDIIKTDTISPILGEEFGKNALLVGLIAISAVVLVVFFRYKSLKVAMPMLITLLSEITILLGVASLIGWNLDLAAIAGIIIVVGTGVDHQIIITDETIKGATGPIYNWKEKLKNAFFIIMGTYFTTCVAMVPLMLAGAGLLKGFAITTIIGVTIGVFITRPAYAAVVELLVKE